MLSKIKNKFDLLIRKVKSILNIDVEYQYKFFSIFLPADHLLPIYQKHHMRYDKFLPHLTSYLEPGEVVIDVGANCGDTLAGMVEANQELIYICIEPDDLFFGYLQKNIQRIKGIFSGIQVHTVKALAGKNIENAVLEGVGGTKHAVVGSDKKGHASKSIDSILTELSCKSVKLLKTDVDGFDYDVIESAENLLSEQSPLIFFECLNTYKFQKSSYIKAINWLSSIGYSDWAVFDNFGEFMLRTSDPTQVIQLLEYVWRQNRLQATRTINYFDVLTGKSDRKALIEKILTGYQ